MTYQPKVSTTQKYSDSQGEHIVHEGKLLLIETDWQFLTEQGRKYLGNVTAPIIISETEEIEVGDWCINNMIGKDHKDYMKIFRFKNHMYVGTNKILALPEHFSDKHLQAIVDGKMKDGDKVLVKYDKGGFRSAGHMDSGSDPDPEGIYLDKDGHVTLFPIQQSLEEVFDGLYDELLERADRENWFTTDFDIFKLGVEWAKKNN